METVICYNESEDKMYIYTNIRRDITKCKKAGYEQIDENNFIAPKKYLSFRAVTKKTRKPMSESQKKKLTESRKSKKSNI